MKDEAMGLKEDNDWEVEGYHGITDEQFAKLELLDDEEFEKEFDKMWGEDYDSEDYDSEDYDDEDDEED